MTSASYSGNLRRATWSYYSTHVSSYSWGNFARAGMGLSKFSRFVLMGWRRYGASRLGHL